MTSESSEIFPEASSTVKLRKTGSLPRYRKTAIVKDVIALDFETANMNRAACSLGFTHVINDEVVSEGHVLINPQEVFEETSVWVHGITSKDVEDAPLFPHAARELFTTVNDQTLFLAHNAKFDFHVLKKNLERYGLASPSIDFMCSVKMSEAFFSHLPSHNLALLSEEIGFTLEHHNALSDARGSLEVFKHVSRSALEQGRDVEDFLEAHKISRGSLEGDKLVHVRRGVPNGYVLPEPVGSEAWSLEGKTFCFAGDFTYWSKKQAEKLVLARGGEVKGRMSDLVDYFVVGSRGFFTSPEEWTERLHRANTLAATRSRMKVIDERTFVDIVKSLFS